MRKVCRILLFIIIAIDCSAQGLDLQLYDEWYGHRNPSFDQTAEILSASAYPVAIATPLLQALYGIGNKEYRHVEYALQSATGLILTTAISYGLKYSVNRKRPYAAHPEYTPLEYDSSPSFPSGHTSFAASTAMSLSLQYKRWYVVAPAWLWASGVAYSRVHRGAHYPGDVVAGILVGAGSAYLSYKAHQWLKKKWEHKTKEKFQF